MVEPDPAHRRVERAAGVPRHLGQYRVPGHHPGVRHQPDVDPVGGDQLRADLRQPAAGLRPAGGPLRPLAHPHHRPSDQRRGVRRVRLRQTFAWLLMGRMLQGLGVALVFGSAPALVTLSVGGAERGRALGFYQMNLAVGFALGPLLGGVLVGRLRLARSLSLPGTARPADRMVHFRPCPVRATLGLRRTVRPPGRRDAGPGRRRPAAGHEPQPRSRLDRTGGPGSWRLPGPQAWRSSS